MSALVQFPGSTLARWPPTTEARWPSSASLNSPGSNVSLWPSAASAVAVTPKTIISSVSLLQWVRGDLGVTLNGSNVSGWADQSGATKNYAQVTASLQPAYTLSDATLGNQATLTFDGVDDFMVAAGLSFLAADPAYIWLVAKQITWTLNDSLIGADNAANAMQIQQVTASPQVRMFSTAGVVNAGMTVGSWFRCEVCFTNNASDFIKIGATSATGNAGQAASTGRRIGLRNGGNAGNFALAELFYCNGIPTGAERTALDAYVTSRYGAGLV